jgi:hypothetical protein
VREENGAHSRCANSLSDNLGPNKMNPDKFKIAEKLAVPINQSKKNVPFF